MLAPSSGWLSRLCGPGIPGVDWLWGEGSGSLCVCSRPPKRSEDGIIGRKSWLLPAHKPLHQASMYRQPRSFSKQHALTDGQPPQARLDAAAFGYCEHQPRSALHAASHVTFIRPPGRGVGRKNILPGHHLQLSWRSGEHVTGRTCFLLHLPHALPFPKPC